MDHPCNMYYKDTMIYAQLKLKIHMYIKYTFSNQVRTIVRVYNIIIWNILVMILYDIWLSAIELIIIIVHKS
jgi:hypothetical protein